jgi:peptide/nickel transport system substrate-binding protein
MLEGHRKTIAVAAVAAGAALAVLASSAAAGARTAAPIRGGTLTMARIADIFTMDPAQAQDDRSIFTVLQIYERLVKLAPNGRSVQPELATSWKFSNGGKTAIFQIRKGVHFSDGSPLTVADVVASLKRESNPKQPWAFLFSPVKSIKPVGKNAVSITSSEPFAPLLSALSTFAGSIYSQKAFAKYGQGKFGTHPLGTGAFGLEKWDKGSQLTLTRNTHYWQKGKPYLDKLVFKVVGDDNARVLQLQSKTVDVIDSVPPNQVQPLEAQSSRVERVNGSAVTWMILNTEATKGPFGDKNVRCAIAWSIDRSAIAKTAYFGTATPAKSLIPASSLYYDGAQAPVGYDLNRAKAFLAKSSKPKGFSFSVDVDSGDSPAITGLQVVAASLKKIGITMNISRLEATTVQNRWNTNNYTSRYAPWTNDTPDPDEMLGSGLDWKAGQDSLHTFYKNAEARGLVLQARAQLNVAKRQALYSKVQRLTNQDCSPFVYLVDIPRLYASTSNVVGFTPNSQGKYSFENVWKTK